MAGDWMEMRLDLEDDPAVIQIADLTDLETMDVVARLYRIWAWANRQTSDGRLRFVTLAWIDKKVSTPGFAAAMCEAKWLKATDAGVSIPKYYRHNGESAKRRAKTRDRVRKHRKKRVTGNATVTQEALPQKRTEEKRTEEQNTDPVAAIAATARSRTKSAPARKKPSIQWSPETGFVGIADADRTRWAAAYPACDLDRQLAAMDVWLRENPAKAHKSRWGRFVSSWLSRSQDRGGDSHATATRTNTSADVRRAAEAAKQYPEPEDRPLRRY